MTGTPVSTPTGSATCEDPQPTVVGAFAVHLAGRRTPDGGAGFALSVVLSVVRGGHEVRAGSPRTVHLRRGART